MLCIYSWLSNGRGIGINGGDLGIDQNVIKGSSTEISSYEVTVGSNTKQCNMRDQRDFLK